MIVVSDNVACPTQFDPLLLMLEDVFAVSVKAFLRVWKDMKAKAESKNDMRKVSEMFKFLLDASFEISKDAQYPFSAFEQNMLASSFEYNREKYLSKVIGLNEYKALPSTRSAV